MFEKHDDVQNLRVYPLHAVAVALVWWNILHVSLPRHAKKNREENQDHAIDKTKTKRKLRAKLNAKKT